MTNAKTAVLPNTPPVELTGRKPGRRLADIITMLAMTLLAIGIVMVYSSSSIRMELKTADATLYLRRQILWAILAACTFLIARSTDVSSLRKWAWPIAILTGLLLIVVLIPGISRDIKGARRWLRFGGMNVQPSEIAKISLVLLLARVLELKRDKLDSFKHGFVPCFAPVAVIAGLVVIEPDFGSGLLLTALGISMIFVAGARWRHLFSLSVPGVLAIAVLIMVKGAHVRARLAAFFDPDSDPNGTSYQQIQALIALGSGGVFGTGLGASRQKRLFLPDVHTDFIFALVGEELGFVGTALVVCLFAALIIFAFKAAFRARDRYSFLVGFGLTLVLGMQATINMLVATGSMPPKGIALPMISFGGSSLCITAAALGMIVNIALNGRPHAPLETSDDAARGELGKSEDLLDGDETITGFDIPADLAFDDNTADKTAVTAAEGLS